LLARVAGVVFHYLQQMEADTTATNVAYSSEYLIYDSYTLEFINKVIYSLSRASAQTKFVNTLYK
jgi:hypothetical protein